MMQDIENRADIDALLRAFYDKALRDETIGYIFTDVAKLEMDHHLPIIGDFWDSMLFGNKQYQMRARNPMQNHLELNKKTPLTSQHFERWLKLWTETVDEMFAGERADMIKIRAHSIGSRMLNMINGLPQIGREFPGA